MKYSVITFLDRTIEYSFYAIFFLVPLVFTSQTFELFEFNKLWLTFALTIIIACAWFSKMAITKSYRIQRTPLDIPIALFVLSQIISTFLSLDFHMSVWGYYSRFNGGLLSILSYVLLYYAFVTNFGTHQKEVWDGEKNSKKKIQEMHYWGHTVDGRTIVKRSIITSLLSAFIVVLWGLPSHFGYDPTCLIFRGTLDVSCWTDAFQPKIRMFSTLGQPNWLGIYLIILFPFLLSLFLLFYTPLSPIIAAVKNGFSKKQRYLGFSVLFFTFLIFFYLCITWTDSQSGFLAFWICYFVFLTLYAFIVFTKKTLTKHVVLLGILTIIFLSISFFIGHPIHRFNQVTFQGLRNALGNSSSSNTNSKAPQAPTPPPAPGELGGTDSGQIRSIVWEGAWQAWKKNPIFGTGTETFALAYYKNRPPAHNLTSEWDYLYNKAHNEYLNYLTTTGIFGLGTYLAIIAFFLFYALRWIIKEHNPDKVVTFFVLATISSYISILVSNFFGFSVVIVQIYFFLLPAFFFLLTKTLTPSKEVGFGEKPPFANLQKPVSSMSWTVITILSLFSIYLIIMLIRFWQADTQYALGYNFNRVNQYTDAYAYLHEAVAIRSDEPTFQDELTINNAILAVSLASQKDEDSLKKAQTLVEEALSTSNQLISEHPNNIVFWKTRVRMFYTLSQLNPAYLPQALKAIEETYKLSPTDAKTVYNLGVLYGQTGNVDKGIELLKKATVLKPDYRDAWFALGLFYKEKAQNEKATETLEYILTNLNPNDTQAKETLESWNN